MTPYDSLPGATTGPAGPLRKILTFIMTLALVGLALMFSALLFTVILAVGAIAACILWWKTRSLRKQMREHPPGDMTMGGIVIDDAVFSRDAFKGEIVKGEIIEGEVIRKIDSTIEADVNRRP